MTVTVNDEVAAEPTPLLTETVTVVTPMGKACGDVMVAAGTSVVYVMVGAGHPSAVTPKL